MRGPADDILLHLKTRGPTQTLGIAAALGVSRQAARQHLERLAAEGLVDFADERAGVGRPRRAWSLSAKGHARFPDTHAQLTLEMIEAVRGEFGEAGLDRLVARRESSAMEVYGQALAGAASLEDRLTRLAAIREREGYMAEWRRLDDRGYLLVENHCPICVAAAACQGFCRSELAMFRALLAPARVERIEHILAGARRCAYRVTDAA
jgi:predicted ArsR family transcriptional regulator